MRRTLSLKFYTKVIVHFSVCIIEGNVAFVYFSCYVYACVLFLTLVRNVAVQELQMQLNSESKLLNVLRSASWKQDGNAMDQYICFPLQNLLLSYPGLNFVCILVALADKFPEYEQIVSDIQFFIFLSYSFFCHFFSRNVLNFLFLMLGSGGVFYSLSLLPL